MSSRSIFALVASLVVLGAAGPASAANILFVADGTNDANIPTVLTAAGHTVTIVAGDFAAGDNPALRGDLSAYSAVFWSASGTGSGDQHTNAAVFTNLTSFVNRGGFVFVTGYDSVASPLDPQLLAFVGGTGSTDVPGAPGAVSAIANELTTGVVDIRGVTPTGGFSDRDTVNGLGADTVAVVSTASGSGVGEAQWTLRTIGRGRIAYVSNGSCTGCAPDPHTSWADTSAGGAGAYNAAVRNFASNAAIARVLFVSDSTSDPNIPTVLAGDGHQVTTVNADFAAGDNPTLRGSLAAYDVVVWSATGGGYGDAHTNAAVFTNLDAFAGAGGFVFVTGYDSVASPADPQLLAFVGGTGSTDVPGPVGPVISVANELTTGRVDIRGVTPTGGWTDRDTVSGFAADTVAVASTESGSGVGQAQWTLRSRGPGRIAYVSNGAPAGSIDPSWDNTAAGGAGAYNAALRNFVLNAAGGAVSTLRPNGSACDAAAECVSGNCVDRVCCGGACGGGASDDCMACSVAAGAAVDGTCGALTAAAAPVVTCRASAGACDAAETCVAGNMACPADAAAPGGTPCRGTAGACDPAETCDGVSATCPADVRSTAGTPCRAAAGLCDAAEACDGVSAACPADGLVTAGTSCRASAGACDPAETCNGMSAACPADARATAGTSCRASGGACDPAETCNGVSALCPLDVRLTAGTPCRASGGACDVAEACDGASAACPLDVRVAAGTSCRASAGACDVAETCDGASVACPLDGRLTAGTPCRAVAGACDVAEVCDGAATGCPMDVRATAGTPCRASAGACDVEEACDGASLSCPRDALAAVGTACRAAAGACDLAEACDGATAVCPPDGMLAAGTECRAGGDACNPAEACDGTSGTCPDDSTLADGSSCGDGAACNGDETCLAGSCGMAAGLDCDDGDACTADSCAEPGGCANDRIDGCCTTDADCDDADPCTADLCSELDICGNAPIAGCSAVDGGPGEDASVDEDAGVAPSDGGESADAGSGPRVAGGCGCSAPGGSSRLPLGLLVGLATVLALVRRRRPR